MSASFVVTVPAALPRPSPAAQSGVVRAQAAKAKIRNAFVGVKPARFSAQNVARARIVFGVCASLEDAQRRLEEEILKARSATKQFGASSKEAASAWDAVEELEAEVAHAKGRDGKPTGGESTLQVPTYANRKSTPIQLDDAAVASLGERIQEALTKAREASAKFGATSKEARVAWDDVEELEAELSHIKSAAKASVQAAAPEAATFQPFMGSGPRESTEMKERLDKGTFFGDFNPSAAATDMAQNEVSEMVAGKIERARARAQEATNKFGPRSKEAAAAWDAFEELEAEAGHQRLSAVKVSETFKAEKAEPYQRAENAKDREVAVKVQAAIESAREATAKFGATSKEARVAWDTVEELEAEASHMRSRPE
eukprot:tig00000980_g6140.t1